MPSLPTGTVTFLFTDIEGSTSLLQRLGDARYAEVLAEHRRLLRDVFAEGHGQEVDTQGDAFLVAFSRARDAVGAAVAAQRALSTHAWPHGVALRVRMGLHTGEPVSETGDYTGLDVHRAARICDAGHGGQVLLSQAVAVLAAHDLPPGVTLRDMGTHRLRNLREPEHLFQVLDPDLPADFPPLQSLAARPNNLPVQLTSFIGREHEIAEVKRLLGAARLVTLTGSGGAGKTRLALQVAGEILDGYPDGVRLVEFAPITDLALVPKEVASVMNVPEQPGRDITETLVGALQPRALLLVLDNCEHLVAACSDLTATLLRTCPHVHILATSREGLGVPGETIWRVPSLSVPQDVRHLTSPQEIMRYDALRLFADRAAATVRGFAITSENAFAVAQVCQRLDGMPLAIELAAARTKVLTVEQIAARLDDRFALLTGGSRTVLPRQQTLRAAIDWSHALLSDKEKVLFRRLCVFAGDCTLEAIEAICSGGAIEARDILDLLTQLTDKSLVSVEMQYGEARYKLPEIIRQYGWERLSESDEKNPTQRRHRDWYLQWADQSDARLSREHYSDRLRAEHSNLRAALDWSMESNDTEPGLRLVGRLVYFWYVDGHWSEGRKSVERALALWGDALSASLARPLLGASFLARSQGEYEKARAFAEKGLAVARECNQRVVPWFLFNLGIVAFQHDGNVEHGKALIAESIALSRELGEIEPLAWDFSLLGHIARDSGEYERAATLYEESLAFARQFGERYIIAYVLRNMGVLALHTRDYAQAAAFLSEGLSLSRRSNWVTEECLIGIAEIACIRGQHEKAARLFGAGDGLRERLGIRRLPRMQARYNEVVGATRAALADEAFAAAWADGRAMALEQAVEYALAIEQPRVSSDTTG